MTYSRRYTYFQTACIAFIIAVILLCSSCKQKTDFSVEIAKIDSTVIRVTGTLEMLNSIDSVDLKHSSSELAILINQLGDSLTNDTINKNTALELQKALKLGT